MPPHPHPAGTASDVPTPVDPPSRLVPGSLPSIRLSPPVLLLVLAGLSLLAGLGLRDPSPPDEPRFVLAARDMVETGQWLFPHRGRELYAEKPPLFMWLQAAAYQLVGNWRAAFLLPSLLAAFATVALTWDLARRLWSRRVAMHAAAALFVCLQFGLQAKRGQIDMVLVAMTTLSLWAMLRHLLQGPQWPLFWLGAFVAGVGTVTKGVGFLPLLVLLPWFALRVGTRSAGPPARPGDAWRWVAALPCFVAGTGVWLLPLLVTVLASGDPALAGYARELLYKQTGERYGAAWHHVQPAWYYLQAMAVVWLPGVLLLPWLLPAWWRRLRRGEPRLWLLLGWSALVLLFFSASPGKREVYIFPMLPALCVAAAPLLPGLLRRTGVRRVLAGWLLVLAIGSALLGLSLLGGGGDWAARQAVQRGLDTATLHALAGWLLALAMVLAGVLAWAGRRRIGPALVLGSAALWTTYGLGLAPVIDADSSARAVMQRVGVRIGPQAELGMVAWREQNLLQSDRPTVDFGFKQPWHRQWAEATAWARANPQRRWLFVHDIALSPCVEASRVIDVGHSNRRRWLLVPGTALRDPCVTPPFGAAAD